MVGGTRETVRWDQGDPPFPDVAPQQPTQQHQLQQVTASSPSNNTNNATCGSSDSVGKSIVGDAFSFADNECCEDGEDEDEGNIGEGVRSGSTTDVTNKEVRYAPSPTTNPTTTTCAQLPLQRAHSRF